MREGVDSASRKVLLDGLGALAVAFRHVWHNRHSVARGTFCARLQQRLAVLVWGGKQRVMR